MWYVRMVSTENPDMTPNVSTFQLRMEISERGGRK